MFVRAPPMHFSLQPITFIELAIGIDDSAFSAGRVFFPVTLIQSKIRPQHLSLSLFFVINQLSIILCSVRKLNWSNKIPICIFLREFMQFEYVLELPKLLGIGTSVMIIEWVGGEMWYSVGYSLHFFGWSWTILACVTHSKYKHILSRHKCLDYIY